DFVCSIGCRCICSIRSTNRRCLVQLGRGVVLLRLQNHVAIVLLCHGGSCDTSNYQPSPYQSTGFVSSHLRTALACVRNILVSYHWRTGRRFDTSSFTYTTCDLVLKKYHAIGTLWSFFSSLQFESEQV